ncbi:MAG: hypothetical protein K1X29_03900 [Bdellovibrionales bacterium]|nr:hypothetical protein [Bdellovibrionales bacterium]
MQQFFSDSNNNLINIGRVKTSLRDIRRRHQSTFSWVPLNFRDKVYQGDSIFTGDQSEAVLVTSQGDEISISSNSLIVLNTSEDVLRIEINYGTIQGQIASGKKILVTSGGETAEIKSQNARIKVEVNKQKKIAVDILEGNAQTVNTSQIEITDTRINPDWVNESFEIKNKLTLISPVGERVFSPLERKKIFFNWKSTLPTKYYLFEIARDENFDQILIKENVRQNFYKPENLPIDERLYWRVSVVNQQLEPITQSQKQSFILADELVPKIIFPVSEVEYSFEENPYFDFGNQIAVTVMWDNPYEFTKNSNGMISSPLLTWELQLAKDSAFNEILKTAISKSTSYDLSRLNEGVYYIRVRSQSWEEARWSAAGILNIKKRQSTQLYPPQIISSSHEFLLRTRGNVDPLQDLKHIPFEEVHQWVEEVPDLVWKEVRGAVQYEVEIATDASFEKVVRQSLQNSTHFQWQEVLLGVFYWRVRGIYPDEIKGPFSDPQKIKVGIDAPLSLTQEKIEEETANMAQLEASPPPFLLRWGATINTPLYNLEFDRDPSFSKPLSTITNNTFKKIQVPSVGQYYWRIRSIDEKQNPISPWSLSYSISFSRTLLNANTTKVLQGVGPVNETLMVIGGGSLKINFRWLTPYQAGNFRFQLSSHSDPGNLIVNTLTQNDFYFLRRKMGDGWYYWRIRLENKNYRSSWTPFYKFNIKNEIKSFDFKTSEKHQERLLAEREKLQTQQLLAKIKLEKQERMQQRKIAQINLKKTLQEEFSGAILSPPQKLQGPAQFVLQYATLPNVKTLMDLDINPQIGFKKTLIKKPIKTTFFLKDFPSFSWESEMESSQYRIEISSDKSFRENVQSYLSTAQFFRWMDVRPGIFYWRIQSRGRGQQPSPYSRVHQIKLSVEKINLLTPHEIFIFSESFPQPEKLRWSPVPFASQYKVEWFEEGNESQIKSLVTTKIPSKSLPFSKEGLYFWKVSALNEENRVLNSSTFRPLQIKKLDRIPAAVRFPILLFPETEQKIFFEADVFPLISFIWKSQPVFGSFVLEVSNSKNFKKNLNRIVTKKQQVILKVPGKDGERMYWRLGLSIQGKILWQSEIRSFILKETVSVLGTSVSNRL